MSAPDISRCVAEERQAQQRRARSAECVFTPMHGAS